MKIIPVNYHNCFYLSPKNEANTKYVNSWSDFQIGQIQYIFNKIMILAHGLGTQYQQYNKTILKIIFEDIPILLPKLNLTTRNKRRILGFGFK